MAAARDPPGSLLAWPRPAWLTWGVGVVRMLVAHLVRHGWRSTVLLGVLASLAAGVAMATIAAGRRTATAFDRFATYADVPELLINFCPPNLGAGADVDVTLCYEYDAVDEVEVLRALPEVEAAARGSFRGLTIAPVDDPEDRVMTSTMVTYDESAIGGQAGRYLVIEGRAAEGADEVLLNEHLADRSGLTVGDRVVLTFWAADEVGLFDDDAPDLHGPLVEVEVVGLGRSLMDLAAAQGGFGSGEADVVYGGPGLAATTADAGEFTGVLVEATGDDRAAATTAIEAAIAPQIFNSAPAIGVDEIEPTRDAIRYEAQATTIVGLVVAVLAIALVAQAVARQSRQEWSDGPILRAVGVTTPQAIAAALLRSLSIGIPAAALSAGLAVLLSPRGPVGIGRRAEVEPGVHVDVLVLATGAAAVLMVVALGASAPLLRGRALSAMAPISPRRRPQRSLPLPPVASAGLRLARSGRRDSAEVGTARASVSAAAIAIVAASVLVASLDDLLRTPARFGATWDVSIGVPFEDEAAIVALLGRPELRRSIDEAAFIRGQDILIGDEQAWVHAFEPIAQLADQTPALPIDEGRAPATTREVAFGALTLEDVGLSIGDHVTLASVASGGKVSVTIVGTAMINDTFEASPGRGAVVTPELMDVLAPEIINGDPAIVSLAPGTDVESFMATVAAQVPTAVQEPVRPAALRNVERIRELPYVMAAIVALLALASLAHALVLSVNRNRRVLGILKGLGFTRRQIEGAVAWHATSYALTATIIGLPLGVMVGRWGWRLVADSLGVPDVPVVPIAVIVAVVMALLVLANLAAAYPGWRAARLSTAAALRSE